MAVAGIYVPNTTWTRLFMGVALIQGILALGLEAYVFTTVEEGLDPDAYQGNSGHTVPMYLSLFIFAFVYELIVVYDALRLNSMIQLVGLCIYNFLVLLYAAVQPVHVKDALDTLETSYAMGTKPLLDPDHHTWQRIGLALIAVVVVQAVATFALAFLTYKLHFEFAWVVYKVINADISMKRRLLNFQIYMALIKFDFFFLLGFLVQVLVLMTHPKVDPEFPLTIAGIFVALAVMCLSIYFARHENKKGSLAIIVAYVGTAVYLSYKLSVLYDAKDYLMIVFAALTLAMMVCTVVMAIVCIANYDKGLRTYTMPQQKLPEEDINLRYTHNYAYSNRASRLDLAD
ncbi:hypothetical protein PG987_014685 [Apiospora arundinis]|uniref:UPF0658 Golgi apparatus membrane protein n=1 Tax=Apiospora arundinis TaxID=335852 RepID=A0ABR2JPM1_9PEZI